MGTTEPCPPPPPQLCVNLSHPLAAALGNLCLALARACETAPCCLRLGPTLSFQALLRRVRISRAGSRAARHPAALRGVASVPQEARWWL